MGKLQHFFNVKADGAYASSYHCAWLDNEYCKVPRFKHMRVYLRIILLDTFCTPIYLSAINNSMLIRTKQTSPAALLLRTRGVPSSNLVPKTGEFIKDLQYFSHSLRQIRSIVPLTWEQPFCFNILSNPWFTTNILTDRRYHTSPDSILAYCLIPFDGFFPFTTFSRGKCHPACTSPAHIATCYSNFIPHHPLRILTSPHSKICTSSGRPEYGKKEIWLQFPSIITS